VFFFFFFRDTFYWSTLFAEQKLAYLHPQHDCNQGRNRKRTLSGPVDVGLAHLVNNVLSLGNVGAHSKISCATFQLLHGILAARRGIEIQFAETRT